MLRIARYARRPTQTYSLLMLNFNICTVVIYTFYARILCRFKYNYNNRVCKYKKMLHIFFSRVLTHYANVYFTYVLIVSRREQMPRLIFPHGLSRNVTDARHRYSRLIRDAGHCVTIASQEPATRHINQTFIVVSYLHLTILWRHTADGRRY